MYRQRWHNSLHQRGKGDFMSVMESWDGFKWYKHDRGITPRELNVLRTIEDLLNKDSIFVDAGAHIGFFTVRVAKVCRHVYAFEPNPESIEILRKNLELNKITNVTVHEVALGSSRSSTKLYLGDTTSTLFPRTDRKTIEVEVVPLDEMVEHCDVIKVDVEGYEGEVVAGAKRLIEKSKPIWVIEHHDMGVGLKYYPETAGTFHKIRALLKEHVCIIFDDGRAVYIPESKLDKVPREALRRLLTLRYTHMVIENVERNRPWYTGLPCTWWYGISMMDFIEQLPMHVLKEPEWLEIVKSNPL